MKKITENIALKITAFVLSYVMVITFILSALAVAVLGYYKFYFSNEDTVKSEILSDMAEDEAYYLFSQYVSGNDIEDYYSDKNIYYEIVELEDENGKITSNYHGQEYMAYATENFSYDDFSSDSETLTTHNLKISVYVAANLTKNDWFSVTAKIIELGFKMQYWLIVIVILSLVFSMILISYLFCAAGHNPGGILKANFFDTIPIEIYITFFIFLFFLSMLILSTFSYNTLLFIILMQIFSAIDYCVGLALLLSIATRIKLGTFITKSLIYRIFKDISMVFRKIMSGIAYFLKNISFFRRIIIYIAAFLLLELIIYFNIYYYPLYSGIVIFFGFVFNLALILITIYLALVMQKIKEEGEKIASGDLQHKIDTRYMVGDLKNFAENLNCINETLQSVIDEKMKSERLKTELITNVSHDIKTPLTSIINYVDLIKKEKIDNPAVNEYVEVLDRHSWRLKKLIEDLIEASKASSGNINMELAPCDVCLMLTQIMGEYEEKFISAGIKPVYNLGIQDIIILADARLMLRIFDNLLNNVLKYALTNTRFFIDVVASGDEVTIVFKNISKNQLDIDAKDLFERFTRADKSRNTEGSGLGLSIAKSLTELQGGRIELEVDGDLFKISVVFKVI